MRRSADRQPVVVAVLLAGLLAPATATFAQATARDLYTRALSLERRLPAAAAADRSWTATDAHRVIAAYEAVVRQHPRSGYADDALWQAGQLALECARRHGRSRDRAKGIALLEWLVREYPTSRLVPNARSVIAGVSKAARLESGVVTRARTASPPAGVTPPPAARVVPTPPTSPSGSAPTPPPATTPTGAPPRRPDVEPPPQQPLWARALWFPTPLPAVRALDGLSVATGIPTARSEPSAVSGAPPSEPPTVARSGASAEPASPATASPGPVVKPGAPPASAAGATSNASGGFSLARQLGLGVSRVVIDPGHGGHDPGALGQGTSEAQVVLDIALRLEALLKRDRAFEVVLTRRTDTFLPLEARTALANRVQADLFLSIHANASRNPNAHGVETYHLNFASNPDAEAVAARENATSGRTMASLPEIVKAITLNTKLDESRDLAGQVHRALVSRLKGAQRGLKDLGVKQAPFVVLIGATMPSILVEVSFLSHRAEGKLLTSPSYRQRVAESLLEGVTRYQATLKAVRTTAQQ